MPLAENRGFEPMMELIHNYFQDSHLKPLGQFSLLVTISLYIVCNRSLYLSIIVDILNTTNYFLSLIP